MGKPTVTNDPIADSGLPLWLLRKIRFEFWSMWFFYLPAFPVWFLMMLRSGKLLYFTAANPGIELGGFFGDSKIHILKEIPEQFMTTTLFFKKGTGLHEILAGIQKRKLQFPLIGKPDVGEKGNGVIKITDEAGLAAFVSQCTENMLIQEFIDFPVELGILYYKLPDGSKSGITSVVTKVFLSVTGDGTATVEQLLMLNTRGRMQLKRLRNERKALLCTVPAKGERILVEPVGNHCRGTLFLNGNHLINDKLVGVFDTITKDMDTFFFGRFDLKVASINDLYEGRNIRIMELNGTTAEPAHIYDPSTRLWKAYRDIFYNMDIVRRIAQMNMKRGIKCTPVGEFVSVVANHFRNHNV
jgi:hypothetical protein